MLLKPCPRPASRAALLSLACVLLLASAGCGPFPSGHSVDGGAACAAAVAETGFSLHGGAEPVAETLVFPSGEAGRGLFRSVRLDPHPRAARGVRTVFPHDVPDARPTPRERREARAMVLAEADLLARGGIPMYRSDGSASTPSGVRYVSAPGALTFDYLASAQLNCIDDLPHALRLIVYHLSDRAGLDRLAEHEDGIRKLLEGEYFDESVKSVRSHHVQPGASGRLFLDRPEGGRYVAVVAGYDRLRAGTSVFVAEYGLGQWKAPGENLMRSPKPMFAPLPLHLRAVLGDSGMAVSDTGKILGNMQRVTSLTRRQTRYLAVEGTPFPVSLFAP